MHTNDDIPERPSVVGRLSVHEVELSPRDTANRSVPTVADPSVEVTCVETLKALVERHPALDND